MSNAFPKSIICRARLWRPEKKFFLKAGKHFQEWVLKTHAWKVGDQEVVRFQVGVDQVHQVQLMHKFQNLKKRWYCRTRNKQNVWNTSAVRWRARGSAIVLSLFVTLIRSRRDPRGASLDTRTLPSEKVKHLGTLFTRLLVLEEKPGHGHVGRAEVWCRLVDPLGNLPQDVPLPVVGRALHLRRKLYFLICFWQRLCFMRQNKLRLDKAWYYNCWKAQTFNTHCSSSPPCHEALNT